MVISKISHISVNIDENETKRYAVWYKRKTRGKYVSYESFIDIIIFAQKHDVRILKEKRNGFGSSYSFDGEMSEHEQIILLIKEHKERGRV